MLFTTFETTDRKQLDTEFASWYSAEKLKGRIRVLSTCLAVSVPPSGDTYYTLGVLYSCGPSMRERLNEIVDGTTRKAE